MAKLDTCTDVPVQEYITVRINMPATINSTCTGAVQVHISTASELPFFSCDVHTRDRR